MTVLLLSYLSLLYLLAVSIFSFSWLKKLDVISLRALSLNSVYISEINKRILSVIDSEEEERYLDYRSLSAVELVSEDLMSFTKLVHLTMKSLKC